MKKEEFLNIVDNECNKIKQEYQNTNMLNSEIESMQKLKNYPEYAYIKFMSEVELESRKAKRLDELKLEKEKLEYSEKIEKAKLAILKIKMEEFIGGTIKFERLKRQILESRNSIELIKNKIKANNNSQKDIMNKSLEEIRTQLLIEVQKNISISDYSKWEQPELNKIFLLVIDDKEKMIKLFQLIKEYENLKITWNKLRNIEKNKSFNIKTWIKELKESKNQDKKTTQEQLQFTKKEIESSIERQNEYIKKQEQEEINIISQIEYLINAKIKDRKALNTKEMSIDKIVASIRRIKRHNEILITIDEEAKKQADITKAEICGMTTNELQLFKIKKYN